MMNHPSSPQIASQILWATGSFSGFIPNGFYSVIPEKRLKELFDSVPSPDALYALEVDANVILVDTEKDKKLSMLKQLIVASVKGLSSNPASMIKKVAGLVSDFYKRPKPEISSTKATLEENMLASENRAQLLGQIRNGLSCRPRAILFKVLADSIGLKSKLVVGLPMEGATEYADSYKHMSVAVVLNSVELLVDLMRFPGQLIPYSSRAILMSHISAAGESDSAENDSCDSPHEPNSPLYGISDLCAEHDENFESLYHRSLAYSYAAGSSLCNFMLRSSGHADRKLSTSQSEPNVTNDFWRRSRRKVVVEQRTASSSPEHPSLFRARGRSMLSGNRKSYRGYEDDVPSSRSAGASSSVTRRLRRRSISITPEISDDIVRAVRAMNETLKQNRQLKRRSDERCYSCSSNDNDYIDSSEKLADFHLGARNEISGANSAACDPSRKHTGPAQKAVSLPSSPHEFRGNVSDGADSSGFTEVDNLISKWNEVLKSSSFLNKPLFPFQEWNIDFSELTIGTRVGIGFFGEVFRGLWNGTNVAIKIFLEQDLTAENMEDFCNEISILSRLRHPNVILFLGACIKPPHLSLITEYMEMGSLYNLVHMSDQKVKLSWKRRLKMLRDICRGLMYLHRMKIAHRDLKSPNCLVNEYWAVKICDFGLSRLITDVPMRDSSSAATPEWMAPELIRNEPFTEKCDVFSLGVIMWELCTLNRPWDGVAPTQVVYAVANEGARLDIPHGPMGKLISDCWAKPDERPSCEVILSRLLDCEYALC